jgi:hypothetical protein
MGIVKIDTIDHADGNWRKIPIALIDPGFMRKIPFVGLWVKRLESGLPHDASMMRAMLTRMSTRGPYRLAPF